MSEFTEEPRLKILGPLAISSALGSDQLLAAIVDSSDDAIASKDLNGIITSWNKGAERLFGYTAEEIIGQSVLAIIPPDRHEEEQEILGRIRRGVRIDHYETVRRRKDGSLVEVSITVSPIRDAHGTIVGASKVARDITDRRRANHAARLLSAIVESSEDAIASKDLNGIVTSWNKSAERVLGYKAEEMIGRPITTIFPPDRLDEEPGVLRRIVAGQRIEHFETVRRRKDGTLVDVSLTISPIRDENGTIVGASKILRDITERKKADRAKLLLSAIVESSDDAIISKDLNGAITSWNQGATAMFGYGADEMIGRSTEVLMVPSHGDDDGHILRRIRRGERVKNYPTVRRRKNGSVLDVSLTVSPIHDEHGNITGTSNILRDITELVRAREILQKTVAEKTAQLRETVTELEAFSYSIAHDMRAPLRSMNSYAQLILSDHAASVPPEPRHYLERIAVGATRLDSLITDVLNYSRVARGEMELTPVQVGPLARDIVDSYGHLREKGAEISVEEPMPTVIGNPAALTQCLGNLLSNAVKFVPADRTAKVSVSAEERGEMVRIWVRDNGIGISEEGQKRLFGMFHRLNPPAQFEGNGIGLAIVRKAVRRMGGRFGLESKPNEGSSFWIELPRNK